MEDKQKCLVTYNFSIASYDSNSWESKTQLLLKSSEVPGASTDKMNVFKATSTLQYTFMYREITSLGEIEAQKKLREKVGGRAKALGKQDLNPAEACHSSCGLTLWGTSTNGNEESCVHRPTRKQATGTREKPHTQIQYY